jgi:hypothetical protein
MKTNAYFYLEGTDTMAITAIDSHQASQAVTPISQSHKPVSAIRTRHDGPEKTKEQQKPEASSPVQDHVTLSKEAQALSTPDPQTSKNNTFQGNTSPFDR